METLLRMTAAHSSLRTLIVLLLVIGGRPLKSRRATPNGLNFGDSRLFQHGSVLYPLLKALSEQGGEPWQDVNPYPKMRAEPRHVQYMKRLYKMSSRSARSADGTNQLSNTVRLITPRDECLEQSKEIFMQELSFNLDRVRSTEQLLRSVLLYSLDRDRPSSAASRCRLAVREQLDQCQLGPGVQHNTSFLVRAAGRSSRTSWAEVDVTPFLLPLMRSHKKNIHLHINLSCADHGGVQEEPGDEEVRRGALELTTRSPSLLLYLNDTSGLAYQRPPASRPAQGSSAGMSSFEKHMKLRPELRVGHRKRRLRRSAPKNRAAAQQSLPELKSVYEFPTSDCALYDFRVSFSQLKMNHWIVYPHWYNPRYCKGTCPRTMGFMYGSPVHTIVQNIIYERLDSSVPRPSCVPSEYKPMSIITEYNGIITIKDYEDMVATRCGCR